MDFFFFLIIKRSAPHKQLSYSFNPRYDLGIWQKNVKYTLWVGLDWLNWEDTSQATLYSMAKGMWTSDHCTCHTKIQALLYSCPSLCCSDILKEGFKLDFEVWLWGFTLIHPQEHKKLGTCVHLEGVAWSFTFQFIPKVFSGVDIRVLPHHL